MSTNIGLKWTKIVKTSLKQTKTFINRKWSHFDFKTDDNQSKMGIIWTKIELSRKIINLKRWTAK